VLGSLYALIISRPHGLTFFIIPAILITLREIWMSVFALEPRKHGISDPGEQARQVEDLHPGLGHRLLRAAHHRAPPNLRRHHLDRRRADALHRVAVLRTPARRWSRVRVEIVAVGTELLLGQIPDTNSQWLGERLAANGIASHFHQHVGDNHERIVLAFRTALARSDAMIVCGGLGPTQDDITRAALAEVMNVRSIATRRSSRRFAPCSVREVAPCPTTTCSRPTCPAARRSSSDPRHRARSDLQGRLKRSSTPCPVCPTRCPTCSIARFCPTCSNDARGGDDVGDSQPRPAHVGGE
jgi:molybdenum cofactor synthesis domain-containing protein